MVATYLARDPATSPGYDKCNITGLNVGAVGQQFRIDLMPLSRQMRRARGWIDRGR
jgi:hypothetical protein